MMLMYEVPGVCFGIEDGILLPCIVGPTRRHTAVAVRLGGRVRRMESDSMMEEDVRIGGAQCALRFHWLHVAQAHLLQTFDH